MAAQRKQAAGAKALTGSDVWPSISPFMMPPRANVPSAFGGPMKLESLLP